MRLYHSLHQNHRKYMGLIPIIMIVIPLSLSAFTHLWNPIGFPYIHGDESHYLRRTMHTLQGLGPQESKTEFNRPYDHPYFGQLFMGGIFGAIGYPHFIDISDSSLEGLRWSIEQLYLYPRMLMGILAVVDTFLIYKITERRYSRNAAFVGSVLFAVMPLTWLTRRVVLESIFLPFILSSILCALYFCQPRLKDTNDNTNKFFNPTKTISKYLPNGWILIFTSGLFLGLAIFTKITAIMMIPLLLYLIFMRSNKSFKALRLWFLPVIIIPMIWPTYALVSGQLQDWIDGVSWQADRDGRGLYRSFLSIFSMDPLLCVIGLSSISINNSNKKGRIFYSLASSFPVVLLIDIIHAAFSLDLIVTRAMHGNRCRHLRTTEMAYHQEKNLF